MALWRCSCLARASPVFLEMVTTSAMCAEPKQHISHSTVEKQRRDRINSLIDEVLPS